MKANLSAIVVCATVFLAGVRSWAQCEFTAGPSPILPSNLDEIDIDGETMATVSGGTMNGPGVLQLWRRIAGAWQQEAQFDLPEPFGDDRLRKLAVDGDRVIVGRGGLTVPGVVYIFHRLNGIWVQEARLSYSDLVTEFGASVDISGDLAAVSANGAAAAYVFRRQGTAWIEEESFACDDEDGWSLRSVAIENDLMVLGDYPGCGPITPRGSAQMSTLEDGRIAEKERGLRSNQAALMACAGSFLYVYRRSGGIWSAENLSFSSPICPGENVLIEGGRIITIAGFTSPNFHHRLLFWDYDGTGWVQGQDLVLPEGNSAILPSLEGAGNRVLVGVPTSAGPHGWGVLFSEIGGVWAETARFVPSPPDWSFGYRVAMNEDNVAVLDLSNSYLFDIRDCDGDGFPDECPDGCDDPQACGDCNNNGTRDGCDEDCDHNGVPDDCGGCEDPVDCGDCNNNGVYDGCDPDCDGNGLADDCDCIAPTLAISVSPGRHNRFLEVTVPDSCQPLAARVKMISLHHPTPPGVAAGPNFTSFEFGESCIEGPAGCVRWAGTPSVYVDSIREGTVFNAAMLSCNPQYHDWGGQLTVALTGAEIIPASIYEVQFLDEGCDPSIESNYSAPVIVETNRWGDVAAPYQDQAAPSPNQPTAVDIAAVVDKVKDAPGNMPRVSAELSSRLINLSIGANAIDIGAVVDAVKGNLYPFAAPDVCK